VVELTNPIELDLSLILLTSTAQTQFPIPLFSHQCQIKNALATFILDNGSQKNLISEDLTRRLSLHTTPNPFTNQLGWVHKDAPSLRVHQQCVVTFHIGPF